MTGKQHHSSDQRSMVIPTLSLDRQQLELPPTKSAATHKSWHTVESTSMPAFLDAYLSPHSSDNFCSSPIY